MNEKSYDLGHKAAWRQILSAAVQNLGNREGNAERWRLERADAVNALRVICERHGDNDWPDDLHLADVLRKHLENYL